jgi:hypothetical protein
MLELTYMDPESQKEDDIKTIEGFKKNPGGRLSQLPTNELFSAWDVCCLLNRGEDNHSVYLQQQVDNILTKLAQNPENKLAKTTQKNHKTPKLTNYYKRTE